jgi:hypothetical protein
MEPNTSRQCRMAARVQTRCWPPNLARDWTSSQIPSNRLTFDGNVKIKDINGNTQRGTGVGNVDYTSNSSSDWCTGQEEIDLFARVAELFKIFYRTETRLSIGNCSIHKMLFSLLIDRKSFKGKISRRTKSRTHVSWSIHWTLETSRLDSTFDKIEFDSNDTSLQCQQE